MPDDRRLPSPWTPPAGAAIFWPFGAIQDYWVDATQRAILMLDALRQRGDTQIARSQSVAPNVLSFQVELLVDGRQLARPVNYGLVRVIPPHGAVVDDTLLDAASHGPGGRWHLLVPAGRPRGAAAGRRRTGPGAVTV